jgi:hypothetical protein
VPGEQYYNYDGITKQRPLKIYTDEKEYEAYWKTKFDDNNLEVMQKESKKTKRTVEEIKKHLFDFCWLLMEGTKDYLDKHKDLGDNLPQSFYDVQYLTVGNKAHYVSKFIMEQNVDVFALQEISAEMFQILRSKLPDQDYVFSPNIEGSIIIAKKNSTFGDLKPREFKNINKQTVYMANDKFCFVTSHLSAKSKKKSPEKNYEDQALEFKEELANIAKDTGLKVILGGDFNQNFKETAGVPEGFEFRTDPVGTDNKMRTALQTQFSKIHVESSAVKDGIIYSNSLNLESFSTITLSGVKITADARSVYIPNPDHPTDHFALMAVFSN